MNAADQVNLIFDAIDRALYVWAMATLALMIAIGSGAPMIGLCDCCGHLRKIKLYGTTWACKPCSKGLAK